MESQGLKAFRSVFRTISFLILLAGIGAVFAGIVLAFVVFRGLPDVRSLKGYHHDHATEVYSDEGRKIGEFYTEWP